MLAKVAPPSNDFQALARYLVRGKSSNPDPKRVAWLFTQNLPTDDPELAARYMEATAQLSARTRKAAYHLMIAWHAEERPTPEAMQGVARQTLQLAGLGDHQALVMGHGDKPHPHLHILLNRVHPGTGRAWKTSQDFARFDRIMHQLSEAHGFAFVPAHSFNPELTDSLPQLPDSAATYAGKRGAPTLRPQWSNAQARAICERMSEHIGMEATPDDVLDILDRHGLTLEAKGKGHVVGNAQGYVRLSKLHLTASAKHLIRDIGPTLSVPRCNKPPVRRCSNVFSVDGVDIARTFETLGLLSRDDVRRAIDDAKAERKACRNSFSMRKLLTTTGLTPTSSQLRRSQHATVRNRSAKSR